MGVWTLVRDIRTPLVGLRVCKIDMRCMQEDKITPQSFYVVQQLSMSTGLCPDARISTTLIQGLQSILCGMRLPLYP